MRTMVAGSVCNRLAIARTLSNTYSRGCSRIGRMISCRLTLSCSMRSPKCIEADGDGGLLRFIRREDCPKSYLVSTDCSGMLWRRNGFLLNRLTIIFSWRRL